MLCPFCIITVALLSLLRCRSAFGPRRLGGVIPSDNGHQTLIVYNEESKALSAQVGTMERCVAWQRCQQQKSVEHTLHRLTSFMCVCERLHVVCTPGMCTRCRDQKRVSDPLELELRVDGLGLPCACWELDLDPLTISRGSTLPSHRTGLISLPLIQA